MCRNITVRHKWNDHGGKAEQKDIPNKRSFFPVFNEERGHLVHKLRHHDDNLVEEKHERGTCLQRLWPLPQTAQCKQLPLFPFISFFHQTSPSKNASQVSRPTALKKENIQTRNRKLSTKSKKKRSGIGGFFPPGIDGRSYGFGAGMAGMGGMSAHPLTNPMGSYYPDLHNMAASQFMSSSSMFGAPTHPNPPLNLSHHSLGTHSQFS